MADILIRNVSPQTRERLRRRAKRQGRSLDADLRDVLEQVAREAEPKPPSRLGFGSWLVSISRTGGRPGADLSNVLNTLRTAPLRRVDFE